MLRKYVSLLAIYLLTHQAWANDFSRKQYADVKNTLQALVQAHPDSVRSVRLGESDSKDMIEGVAIGNGTLHNLVVATHHGNEYGSTEVGLAFASALAEKPIPEQTVYVIPVLNITGYNHNNRDEPANGVNYDPNRDYPGPCGTEGPHKLKSTALLAKFIEDENIVTTATLHTYHPAVVYPWGFSTYDTATPYNGLFIRIAKDATEVSHYTVGNSGKIIYPADGTLEDYAFWKSGVWSMLFELGYSHSPTQAQVNEMIRVNIPGIRKMLEKAPTERAINHAFTGTCSRAELMHLDRHDE